MFNDECSIPYFVKDFDFEYASESAFEFGRKVQTDVSVALRLNPCALTFTDTPPMCTRRTTTTMGSHIPPRVTGHSQVATPQ